MRKAIHLAGPWGKQRAAVMGCKMVVRTDHYWAGAWDYYWVERSAVLLVRSTEQLWVAPMETLTVVSSADCLG